MNPNELSHRYYGVPPDDTGLKGEREPKEDDYIYTYDGNGRRARMKHNNDMAYYICDEAGRVIFETDDTPNRLKNPSLENGTNWAPWYTYTPSGSCTWTVVSNDTKGGFYAVKGTNKEDTYEAFIQKVQYTDCPVPFVISVYAMLTNLTGGIRLAVDFYNGATWLGSKYSDPLTGTTDDYVQIVLPVSNAPRGTNQMDIFIRKEVGTGNVRLDCFRLERGTAPTPNDCKYIYANNTHLAKIDALGEPYFYHCDALGTPIWIFDKDGNSAKYETYYAFGKPYSSSGPLPNTHRFTDKEYETSGIYYFGARYYEPTLGRFLTPDPMGKFELNDPRTINPYVYCTSNPLFYVDPDGRVRWKVVGTGALNVVTGGLAAVSGGGLVTSSLATTPIGGLGVLQAVGGIAIMAWGTMEFGQGITNLTLGLADQEAIEIPETIGRSIAGKKGVVAVKVGKLALSLTTPSAGEAVNREVVSKIIKAIESGATIQEIYELGEELGIEIEASFENLPPIEPFNDPREEIREKLGRKKESD